MPQMAPTSPAVITVTSTQPGTSPRWSRGRGAVRASRARTATRVSACIAYLVSRRGSGRGQVEPDDTGPEGDEHGHREDQEDDRHHHEDLLAGGDLDQLAPPG